MQTNNYWTGLADVTSKELPKSVKGAIYRVLTYAESYEAFIQKVSEVLENSGDEVSIVEEAEVLTDFLKHSWLIEDHEIYEMMETSEKNREDVVSGQIQFYSYDDA